jgi:peptidyl-tRNA hydrolase ICT1
MSVTRSGSSFLHALAGSSARRVQPHLLARIVRHRSDGTIRSTSLPTPPPLLSLQTSKDTAAAHDWLMRFKACSIPRAAVDITFSRSSGPGGQVCATNSVLRSHRTGNLIGEQNVNKVNTKATVRCALDSTWIPSWARDTLQKSVSSGA